MTRAREELVFTWAQDYGGRRSRAVSQFVTEALDLPPATPSETVRPALLERLARHEGSPRDGVPAASRPRLGDRPLNLSYGQIHDYLECPAKYRYGHVVRIPTPVSHAMVYGRALHAAAQAYHRCQLAGRPMRVEELHAALDAAWESVGFLTREHEEARRAAAHEAIERFWADEQRDPARPIAVEQDFTVAFGPDRLRGRYDRVDRDEAGRVVITDYKSSDVRDLATANRRSRESLQLSIYALAHEAQHGALPDELALHFLESGIVGRSEPSEKRLAKAQERLTAAAEGIRGGRFEATPSAMACGYCPFREICPDASR
jgi:DNA helicase-2/ATP-dependent DNA helicase PcrA